MTFLTDEQKAKLAETRNALRESKGLPPLASPELIGVEQDQFTTRPPVSRAVAIAALYALKVSYGQLMELFHVSQSTVYDAVSRHVPAKLRQLRGAGRGRPLVKHETASMLFDCIRDAGPHNNAITLAARVQELASTRDPTE